MSENDEQNLRRVSTGAGQAFGHPVGGCSQTTGFGRKMIMRRIVPARFADRQNSASCIFSALTGIILAA